MVRNGCTPAQAGRKLQSLRHNIRVTVGADGKRTIKMMNKKKSRKKKSKCGNIRVTVGPDGKRTIKMIRNNKKKQGAPLPPWMAQKPGGGAVNDIRVTVGKSGKRKIRMI